MALNGASLHIGKLPVLVLVLPLVVLGGLSAFGTSTICVAIEDP